MPNEVQRLIRKLQPNGPRSFDEQTWPIYVAIVVLCGYLVGVVVSLLNFDDPRIHANAFTWLATLTVLAIVGVFCVRTLQQRFLRRTLVLSLLLSMIVNVSILVAMAWTSILHAPWIEQETKTAVQRQREDVVIPEYPLFNESQQQNVPQEYERPVETGELEAEKRIELTRQSTPVEPEQMKREPTPSITAERQQDTSQPERFESPSAPRESQTLAKLSRQTLRNELNVSRSPNPPTPSESQSQPNRDATVSQTEPQKQDTQLDPKPVDSEADVAPKQVDVAELARKDTAESESTQVASLPTLKRKLHRPKQVPQTDTPIENELTKPERNDEAVESQSTLVQQRTTASPEQMTSIDLQPKVAINIQRQTKVDRPETATLSESLDRASLAKSSKSDNDAPTPVDVDSSEAPSAANASSTSIAKQSAESPESAAANAISAENASAQPSAATLARARSDSRPSVSNASAKLQSTARSKQLAAQPRSTDTDVAAAVEVESNSLNPATAAKPSRLALSRSSIGVAGVGDASNLERGVAAPDSPVSVASASANRAEATQNMEEAFALSPSAPSLTRQLRATATTPSTSIQAQPIDTAMVAGATAPAEAASSSSATLERAPSNAASASVTAAKGSTEVDLGPTKIAADSGAGRAEGGGQPEINTGEVARALPRTDSVAGAAGVVADTAAPDSAAPAAEDISSTTDALAISAGTELNQSKVDAAAGADAGEKDLAEAITSDATEIQIAASGGARADDDDSQAAAALAEGGNSSPGRSARALKLRSDTNSDVPSLAGAESSTGARESEPLDAVGSRAKREATGLNVGDSADIGAIAGEVPTEGTPDRLATPGFARQDNSDGVSGESLAINDRERGAPQRSRRAQVSGSSTNVELDPEEFAENTPSTGSEDALEATGLDGTLVANAARPGAKAVEMDAIEEAGGLGDEPAPDAGILARSASPDSDLVSLQPARFLRRTRPGAAIAAKTDVATPTKAFRRRMIRKGEEIAGERELPSPKTEAAIELGLVFLSKYQSADGSWSFNNFADGKAKLPDGEEAIIVADTGATGLSLLSFLGAGYHHKADKYQQHVKSGLDFLVQHQRADGDLFIDQDPNSSRSA